MLFTYKNTVYDTELVPEYLKKGVMAEAIEKEKLRLKNLEYLKQLQENEPKKEPKKYKKLDDE